MARGRTHLLPYGRISFLVAGCSAVAEYREDASVVDIALSLYGYASVRHPLRISDVFRSRCLSNLSFRAAKLRYPGACRSRVRCGIDVDLRHDRVPDTRGHSDQRTALAIEFGRA